MCTVHYNPAPVTSAALHVWNQNSLVVQIMFISSHEIEHSISNKPQRLGCQKQRRRTKRRLRNTRSVPHSFQVHFPALASPPFSLLSQLSKIIILVSLTFFCTYCNFCTAMMSFDHDKFLPPVVKLSTTPCCTYFSSQYDGTHYNDNAQHGARYSSEHTTLPLPGESQRTYLSTVNVNIFVKHPVSPYIFFYYPYP